MLASDWSIGFWPLSVPTAHRIASTEMHLDRGSAGFPQNSTCLAQFSISAAPTKSYNPAVKRYDCAKIIEAEIPSQIAIQFNSIQNLILQQIIVRIKMPTNGNKFVYTSMLPTCENEPQIVLFPS